MKTMRQVVSELQTRGNSISYHVRSDGGILIRSINGVYYRGASGNKVARAMVGVTLSEARSKQLREATITKKQLRTADTEIKSEWRRVRELWRKSFPKIKGEPNPAGKFTWRRIQYSINKYGKEEALRRIHEAEKYASGLAYYKNVEELASFIKKAGNDLNSQELKDLADLLLQHSYEIRDEWIRPAYDELYKLNNGVPANEVAANVQKILRL